MFYADGRLTGDPDAIDFEDWEGNAKAREVHYLWPDGSVMDEENESHLDDCVIFPLAGDPHKLVMYTNMSCKEAAACTTPFIGMITLVNP
jgi:hypothetical protein